MKQDGVFDPQYWYKPLTKEKLKYVARYKTRIGLPMLVFLILYSIGFAIIEHINVLHYTVIHTPLDDMIPFCEVFIIPYLSWFVYAFLFVIYMFLQDEKAYHRICAWFAIGMSLFLVVSVLFPNILLLRPETMPRHNVFTWLCSLIYKSDTPTNVTPSIHVYNSIGVMIEVWHTNCKRVRSRGRKIAMDIWGIVIILSTMFVKQHSVSDVLVAIGLSLVVYVMIYRLGFVFCGEERTNRIYREVFTEPTV